MHADMEIVIEFQEVEARDRRLGHVGLKFLGLELPFACAGFPGLNEIVDNMFGFTNDPKVGSLIEMQTTMYSRTANDDRLPAGMAEIHDVERVDLLRQHAAGEDQSAQSRSASLNSSVLRLTSRIDQECGSNAAIVIRPSGGAGYLAPKTSAVRLKFQNVSASNRG